MQDLSYLYERQFMVFCFHLKLVNNENLYQKKINTSLVLLHILKIWIGGSIACVLSRRFFYLMQSCINYMEMENENFSVYKQ